MDLLERVKLILGIDIVDYSKDDVLNEFINNFSQAVNLYCNTTTLPLQLEYIVVECSISRYNRMGSEGLQSEGIDVISSTYVLDILEPYKPYMDAYRSTNSLKKVKFL